MPTDGGSKCGWCADVVTNGACACGNFKDGLSTLERDACSQPCACEPGNHMCYRCWVAAGKPFGEGAIVPPLDTIGQMLTAVAERRAEFKQVCRHGTRIEDAACAQCLCAAEKDVALQWYDTSCGTSEIPCKHCNLHTLKEPEATAQEAQCAECFCWTPVAPRLVPEALTYDPTTKVATIAKPARRLLRVVCRGEGMTVGDAINAVGDLMSAQGVRGVNITVGDACACHGAVIVSLAAVAPGAMLWDGTRADVTWIPEVEDGQPIPRRTWQEFRRMIPPRRPRSPLWGRDVQLRGQVVNRVLEGYTESPNMAVLGPQQAPSAPKEHAKAPRVQCEGCGYSETACDCTKRVVLPGWEALESCPGSTPEVGQRWRDTSDILREWDGRQWKRLA